MHGCAGVQWGERVDGVDRIELKYLGCMKNNFKGECLIDALAGHWDPRNKKV